MNKIEKEFYGVARIVNDSWFYSANWKKPTSASDKLWKEQALTDARFRLAEVSRDRDALISVIKKLELDLGIDDEKE